MSEWPLGTSAIKKDNVRDVKSCHCRKIRLNCKMAWEQNVRLERRSANEVNVVGWISIYFESPIISSAKYLTIQPRKHSIVSKVSFNFKTGTNDPNYHLSICLNLGPCGALQIQKWYLETSVKGRMLLLNVRLEPWIGSFSWCLGTCSPDEPRHSEAQSTSKRN